MCSSLIVRVIAATLWTGVVAPLMPAAAQASPEAGRAISTVMDYRRSWLDDSTRFDACKVQQAMNGARDFASHIIEPVRGLLDDPTAPCPRPPRNPREYRAVVLVDSLRLADTTARVYLTVLRGEFRHREVYALRRGLSSSAYMAVEEVRLWGNGRSYGTGWPPPPITPQSMVSGSAETPNSGQRENRPGNQHRDRSPDRLTVRRLRAARVRTPVDAGTSVPPVLRS